ncbi:unnamed protein product [Rhizophagus irregularis]|nr:unnamed protein product [Rhizophagus irregularis]
MSEKRKAVQTLSQPRKRVTLTKAQKYQLCLDYQKKPRLTQEQLAIQYGIKQNTVSDILKNKDKWLLLDLDSEESKKQRERPVQFPEVEEAMTLWVTNALEADLVINTDILREKAEFFARSFEVNNFKASNGWISNFKKRHNMKEYVKWGEAASAPLETLNEERQKLREIIKDYDLNDVFNCDETGLYWDLEPSKTLARGPLSGKKKSKKRVTILLTCNATGTEKLTPFFIHTSKNPRALKGKKKDDLPVNYYWNKTAWMQVSIWNDYLKKLDTKMRLQNRKILLLVDNAPVHITNENTQLTNVTLHFLPPNTTSHLQPCDAGIINSFKAKYRKLLVKNRVEAYEISQQLNKGANSLNIHDAIVFCTNAWNAVTQETIYNCWKHTGILPLVNQEEVDESVNQLGEDNQVEREEIQFLIDQLPFDDHMDADEFIHVDDHLKSNEGLTDEEIISLVNLDKNELEVESDEEIPSVISKVQALNDLDDLVMFFKYSSLNNSINQSELNTLQKLRHEVLRSHITDLKQATLDSYFTSNPNNVII